ncbi:hypothetical protein NDU88_010139 [Pleurodeles waltl]|uniref:Uncharacterized protein n=1 Tax=Pleurodeles waltl TaxID=8319 RepID=A0AAV7QWM3_PLEWA|nr:hypothetical protein NDU88_010139 [Pleurodeles waltl]
MHVSARVGPRPEASGPSVTTGSLALPVGPLGNRPHREREASVVTLGPEASGLGPTRALTRIHAGAPAQLGRPP